MTEEKTMPSTEKPKHCPDYCSDPTCPCEHGDHCRECLPGQEPNHTHIRRQVEAFHKKFSHPVLPVPMVPADRVIRKRLAFIVEEVFEAVEACCAYSGDVDTIRAKKGVMIDFIRKMGIDVDLPEFVDALGDLDYMTEGTRLECGVNGMEIANEIQRANMSKSTEKDEHGKTVKPEGWTPPDVEGVLVKMGWVK